MKNYITNAKKIKTDDIYHLIKDNLEEISKIGENILQSVEEQEIIREYDLEL